MSDPPFPTRGREAAGLYLSRGWQPIRLDGPRAKEVTRKGWRDERVSADANLGQFDGTNVGLRLGLPDAGRLVDADLDCREAVAAAPFLLPDTGLVSGRRSNPRSHYWYLCPTPPARTEKFKDEAGDMLIELRSGGEMTVVPPSTNPGDEDNGHIPEAVEWCRFGEPAAVPADELRRAVAAVAGAALLARNWPRKGRHDAALVVAGALLRSGWTPDRVKALLEAVCAAARDTELANRLACVDATAERQADPGARVSGWPKLAELFGEPVTARLGDWLVPTPKGAFGQGKPGASGRAAPPTAPHVPLPPYRPFPVEVMPGPWADFCRAGGRVLKCDSGFVALPALAVLASAVGMTRRIDLGGEWTEPAVFWCCDVGESGGRKSPAAELSARLAVARQKKLLAEYKAAADAHQQEAADRRRQRREEGGRKGGGKDDDDPPPPKLARVAVSDITIEKLSSLLDDNPRGLLLYRDELAGWLGSFGRYKGKGGGTDEPNWLSIHRADAVIYDRKTGDKITVFVPHAAVSVSGTIQPGKLRRLLGPELMESGFAARVLFCYPPRTPKEYVEGGIAATVKAAAERSLAALYDLAPGVDADGLPAPVLVRLSAPALARWKRFVGEWGQRQFDTDGDLAADLAKLEGYAARFALLHHLVEAGPGADAAPVRVASVEAGIRLVGWAAYETARIYHTLHESEEAADLRRLAELAHRLARRSATNDRLTARDLQRANGAKYPNQHAATAALDSLAAAGVGEWGPEPVADGPGLIRCRPFVLRPSTDKSDRTPDDEADGFDFDFGGPPDTAPDGQALAPQATGASPAATHDTAAGSDPSRDVAPRDLSDSSGVGYESGASTESAREPVLDAVVTPDPDAGSVGSTVVTDPAGLGAVEAAVRAAAVIGLDTETTGLDPRADRLRLLSLHTPAGTFLVDCFAVNPAPLFDALAAVEMVGHNLLFDLAFLHRLGFVPGRAFDTMLASQVLDAGDRAARYTLKDVAARHLSTELDKQEQKSDWSGPLTPDQFRYAALDAAVPVRLRAALQPKVAAAGLTDTLALEHRALPAVHWMGVSGVGLNRAGWAALAGEAEAERGRLAAELDALCPASPDRTGPAERNWNSPEQVKQALAGVGVVVTSTAGEALAGVPHPLAELVQEYRSAAKRAGTYGRAWLEHVAADDRVYPDWRQLGAGASGRMSCAKPNLQQLPRDGRYRRLFVAPPGRVLVKADYSQIELRLAAKIAGEPAMLAAYRRGEDLHTNTARAILGVEQVTKADRQLAKAVNFGLLYGMGAKAFAVYAQSNFGVALTESQAAAYRRKFFAAYPGLAAWHRRAGDAPRDTRTAGGRRRLAVARFTERLNTPVQGTGADGLKAALALLWERRAACPGAVPVLAVHDEVVVEANAGRAEAAKAWLVAAMTDGMAPLAAPVPVEVEATIARTWGGE